MWEKLCHRVGGGGGGEEGIKAEFLRRRILECVCRDLRARRAHKGEGEKRREEEVIFATFQVVVCLCD